MIASRFQFPRFIERAKTQAVIVEVWDGSGYANPTAAAYTLYRSDGTKAVDGAAADSIVGGIATYTLDASAIPTTVAYSTRWREEWAVTVDGTEHTLRRDVHLIPLALYPVVTVADIEVRYTELRRLLPQNRDSWAHVVDEAWQQIVGRLVSEGKQPGRIISPWSLRESHVELALCLAFREVSIYNPNGQYQALADHHCERFDMAWAGLKFEYDIDDDGDADENVAPGGPILATSANIRGPRFGWRK